MFLTHVGRPFWPSRPERRFRSYRPSRPRSVLLSVIVISVSVVLLCTFAGLSCRPRLLTLAKRSLKLLEAQLPFDEGDIVEVPVQQRHQL